LFQRGLFRLENSRFAAKKQNGRLKRLQYANLRRAGVPSDTPKKLTIADDAHTPVAGGCGIPQSQSGALTFQERRETAWPPSCIVDI
jgi:hypothetical protein